MNNHATAGPAVSSTAVRALRVLEILAASGDPVSITEVAAELKMEKVTAYRMLITLEHAGYVVREDASRRFRLSYKVVSLSRNLLAENEVSRLVQQKLREISNETKETLHYSVLDGHEAVLVHADIRRTGSSFRWAVFTTVGRIHQPGRSCIPLA
ncbi:MAG: helix-turn-helix domain-containing protein, partial [Spirochaetia bacterium]